MKIRVLVTRFQNPQSEIRNPKFLGLIWPGLRSMLPAPCSVLFRSGAAAEENLSDRLSDQNSDPAIAARADAVRLGYASAAT